MTKYLIKVLTILLLIAAGCSDDNSTNNNQPGTGEVLLAEVSGDSVGINSGSSTRTLSITSSALNFSDRDSARISFYYSRSNNHSPAPMSIFYVSGSNNVNLFNLDSSSSAANDVYVNVTVPSPRVSEFFSYKINAVGITSSGFAFFKFRDLKIYKK